MTSSAIDGDWCHIERLRNVADVTSSSLAPGSEAATTPAGLAATLSDRVPTAPAARFDEAVARMRAASKPMLNYLTPNERSAANAEELLG